MARNPTVETPHPERPDPWALLAQWHQQFWQAWPHVVSEAVSKAADGDPSQPAWNRQFEALNAAARQATLEQQALVESWQQVQGEFAEYWRAQYAELMRRFNGSADQP